MRGFITIYLAMEGGGSYTYEGKAWGSLANCTYGFDGTLLNKPASREGSNDSKAGNIKLTEEQKKIIKDNICVQPSNSLANPDGQVAKFWDMFFSAFEEVTLEVYDLLATTQIQVELLELQEFRNFSLAIGSDNYYALGWTTPTVAGMNFLTFSPQLLGNLSLNGKEIGYNDIYGKVRALTGEQIIVHEIGHVWAWQNLGYSMYTSLADVSKENWAIYFCNNNYNRYNNMHYEAYSWPDTPAYIDNFYFKR